MASPSAPLQIAQVAEADAQLARDPFSLLAGMLLDQQIPMERAFAGPHAIALRMGTDRLDPVAVAALPAEEFAAVLATKPAVHRFPGSMAARVQALAHAVLADYDGDTSALWSTAGSGAELLGRLEALPGFGQQKAKIFLALLGKQLGVRPDGWREAASPYGEEGSFRSVADVTGPEALAQVRATKRAMKAARESASKG